MDAKVGDILVDDDGHYRRVMDIDQIGLSYAYETPEEAQEGMYYGTHYLDEMKEMGMKFYKPKKKKKHSEDVLDMISSGDEITVIIKGKEYKAKIQ